MNLPLLRKLALYHFNEAATANANFLDPNIANNAEKKGEFNLATSFHLKAATELANIIATAAKRRPRRS
jgi:hypothetical protein